VQAVLQNLVGQLLVFRDTKAKVLKESWYTREKTDALDSTFLGLLEERPEEQATCAASLDLWPDDDRADLGEVWPIDMKSSTADELVRVRLDNGERPDVLTNLLVRTTKESPILGEAIY
jgi:hypothetical protein